ncbi:MAG: excalibur calcium-binding domain-containing protein [Pseudomonadota bacterium]
MLIETIEQTSTLDLWAQHQRTTDFRVQTAIEAELALRGEARSGSTYLGASTSSFVGVTRYTRTTSAVTDKDCNSFETSADAQKFFVSEGGPAQDPHGLDRDGDGFACEWGTRTRRAARDLAPRPPSATPSRCYVGPRGGTYTLTRSGRRDYSGC